MAAFDIAVVVPAYNAAATLPDTLAALARQTYDTGRVDVVVVDDGSTDDTAALAQSFAARDARFTVVRQPNAGCSAARNSRLTASTMASLER